MAEKKPDDHNQLPGGKRKPKAQKLDTHILSTFEDDRYLTDGEDDDTRKGGAKMHPLLRKILKPCRLASDPAGDKIVRCIASRGCNVTWSWPRARQRIMKHAANECPSMAKVWRQEARDYMTSQTPQGKMKVVEAIGSESDSGPAALLEVTERPMKKLKIDSKQQAASISKQVAPFNKRYVTEGNKVLKENGDHALMLFVTCTGIPPHVIDSAEFRTLCSTLNANYKPPSATTLSDRLIPNESARISKVMVDYLKTQRDLTITFDGGKIRKPNHSIRFMSPLLTGERFCLSLTMPPCSAIQLAILGSC